MGYPKYPQRVTRDLKDRMRNFFLVSCVVALAFTLVTLVSNGKKKEEFEKRVAILEFDRIRLEDASNIVLALQDYQFEHRTFPDTLDVLKEKEYLDKNNRLVDPLTKVPYFYQKRAQDFILCVWLSDMVKGVNTSECSAMSDGNISAQKPEEN